MGLLCILTPTTAVGTGAGFNITVFCLLFINFYPFTFQKLVLIYLLFFLICMETDRKLILLLFNDFHRRRTQKFDAVLRTIMLEESECSYHIVQSLVCSSQNMDLPLNNRNSTSVLSNRVSCMRNLRSFGANPSVSARVTAIKCSDRRAGSILLAFK